MLTLRTLSLSSPRQPPLRMGHRKTGLYKTKDASESNVPPVSRPGNLPTQPKPVTAQASYSSHRKVKERSPVLICYSCAACSLKWREWEQKTPETSRTQLLSSHSLTVPKSRGPGNKAFFKIPRRQQTEGTLL